ncbi:glycosyltransferase [Oceanihabitans sp. 2_MG-2023]|uniref:glycosyltransferase n=1 Tax=Oceanihabitans sp. 2_MG-2023 TaxID=3062661 RepID=UPI0026E2D63E|nr:glycosyltransferase [Oceanihabitans sp. 2_MG-2023]MDO6596774.1 glycosyltransferase [Oceanihabitans sp. 2_MG-2023]
MSKQKIKITFVIPSLAAGGAERILSFVAKNIDKNKFQPTLLVVGFEKDTVYDVSNLEVAYLNKTRVLKAVFAIVKHFRSQKPQIVVSSIFHLNTIIAYLSIGFPKIKFAAREANVLSVLAEHDRGNRLSFSKKIIVKAYKLVDCLICQSKDMQNDMMANYGVAQNKTALINNPITFNAAPKTETRNSNKPLQIITVGRLSKEKGHARIIEVLSKLKFPFHYFMIGDGNEKEYIVDLIRTKGIENQVTQIDYIKDVEGYLRMSDVFLLGSYSEGFPNALIESCVVGTPIIAFNAPGGINEIIAPGKNGFIINTVDECVKELTKLNNNYSFSPKTVNQIVVNNFNSKKIINQYEELFIKLTTTYAI